jgi:hypothetical protein
MARKKFNIDSLLSTVKEQVSLMDETEMTRPAKKAGIFFSHQLESLSLTMKRLENKKKVTNEEDQ